MWEIEGRRGSLNEYMLKESFRDFVVGFPLVSVGVV